MFTDDRRELAVYKAVELWGKAKGADLLKI